jgi:hypothetical protein
MRAEGMSYYEIAAALNEQGLKTKRGTGYHNSTVARIIKNQRYIGRARWRGQYYESQGPAIVPLELWNRVHQEVQPARTVQRRAPRENSPYLVELYCRECGSRMYGEWVTISRLLKSGHRADYNEYGIYHCVGRRRLGCAHQARLDLVHGLVLEELRSIVTRPAVVQALIDQRGRQLSAGAAALQDRILYKEKDLHAKTAFMDKLKADYRSGALSAILYSEIFEETSKELAALDNEVKNLKEKLRRRSVKIQRPEVILQRLGDVLNNWENLPNISRRKIIAGFLPRIEISRNGVLFVVRNLPGDV